MLPKGRAVIEIDAVVVIIIVFISIAGRIGYAIGRYDRLTLSRRRNSKDMP